MGGEIERWRPECEKKTAVGLVLLVISRRQLQRGGNSKIGAGLGALLAWGASTRVDKGPHSVSSAGCHRPGPMAADDLGSLGRE